MATIPTFGQFQNYFHSVDTILGIPKDVFCKQDIILKRLKDTLTEKDWSTNVNRQALEVKAATMKTCKGITASSFFSRFQTVFIHSNIHLLFIYLFIYLNQLMRKHATCQAMQFASINRFPLLLV